jgi:methanogenic corrinoid protein MtbC1
MNKLIQSLVDLDEETFLIETGIRLRSGEDPAALLHDCQEAMEIIGALYEKGEYFVAELVYAGEIFQGGLDQIEARLLPEQRGVPYGRIVFGTVAGDIHSIGKNIVVKFLRANNFEVIDLGEDISAERFVAALEETDALILGLNALLTTSYDSMKTTIEALEQAGLRQKVKVMIGGGLVNEIIREYTGADAWGKDPFEAVRISRRFLEEAV